MCDQALSLVCPPARPGRACPGSCLGRKGGTSMPKRTRVVIGGVDTHGRTHHAAAIDQQGRLLGDRGFAADRGGYRQLLGWLGRHGHLDAVGSKALAATALA